MNRIEIQSPQPVGGPPKHVMAEMRRTQGFLTKKGGAVHNGGWRNWKRRWFVVKWFPNQRGGGSFYLYYYKAKDDRECRGSINLQDAQVLVRKLQHSKGKVEFEFQLLLKNGNMLQLYADTAEERDEWVHSLGAASSIALVTGNESNLPGYRFNDEDLEEVFEAGELLASQCQAFGPGIFGGKVGHPAVFGIQANDQHGMPLQSGGLPLTATLEDADHLYNAIIADKEDGTYEGRYVTCKPGEYQLHIKLNSLHDIQGSPFHVTISPSRTYASECSVDGLQLRVTPNTAYTFNIIARDAFSNHRLKGGDPFEVTIAGTAVLTNLEDNEDGTYTCSFETLHPEMSTLATPNLEIQVSVFGTNIRGSPFRLVMQHANITSATPSYRSDMFTESDQQRQAAHNSRSEAHEDRSELVSSRQPLSSPVHEVGYGSRLDGSPAARSSFNHTAQSPAFGVTGNSGGASSRLQAARERVIRARQLQEQARNREKSPPRAEPRTQGRTTAQHASPTQANSGKRSRSAPSSSAAESQPLSIAQLPALNFQVPPQPDGLNEEQQILWSSAAGAVDDAETVALLQDFQPQLEAVFLYFSLVTDHSGKRLIPFVSNVDSGPGQGYLRMLQQYDICPTYVSKRDAKKAYILICKMYNVPENNGLPINGFVHALVLTTLLGLSRPTYQNLYPNIVNKVNVMIKMWGVGVPHKLQVLKSNKRI